MRLKLFFLLQTLSFAAYAQNDLPATLIIGEPAPPLRVSAWLKGTPIQQFAKGQVYVLEFWATWCAPCRAAMPHMSALAAKYRGKVTFIGVDIMEMEGVTIEKVKAFVDSLGSRMNYTVAVDDNNFMARHWYEATVDGGIPKTIVVDATGKVAWIGHPAELADNLKKIVNGNWDLQKALARRNEMLYLDSLDREMYYRLVPYIQKSRATDTAKAELELVAINSILVNEPRLKYTPTLAYQTLAALLRIDKQKAYAYAKAALEAPVYTDPVNMTIKDVVNTHADSLDISPELYQLAAEAWQKLIDSYAYPELINMAIEYAGMAALYARANNKRKAIAAQQKAIDLLKSRQGFSAADLRKYESQLEEYRKL